MKQTPKAGRADNPQAAAAQALAAATPCNTGKTLLVLGASKALPERVGVQALLTDGSPAPGVLTGTAGKVDRALANVIAALGKHRHPEREAVGPAS